MNTVARGPVQPRRRVVVVTRNLPPLIGGMERLIWHVVGELAKGHEVSVVGPSGCKSTLPTGVQGAEVSLSPLWKFLLLSLWRAAAVPVRRRRDIYFAGSGLTAPATWLLARLRGAKCVVFLHGLDMIAPSLIYRRLWLPLIRRHDLCIVNSRYSRSLALGAGLRERSLRILNPGVEFPVAPVDGVEALRSQLDLSGSRTLLYVGRLTPRKGLLEFVEQVMPELLRRDRNLRLVVVGEEASNALGGSGPGYSGRVRAMAEQMGVGHAIRYLGACPDQVLAAAYAAADVLVFPVVDRPGDAEGFGMVAIEAAAHGTPTVAFAVGGLMDAVGDGISGMLVPPGDYAAFTDAVMTVATNYADAGVRQRCREFAAGFRWESFGARLRSLIATLEPAAA